MNTQSETLLKNLQELSMGYNLISLAFSYVNEPGQVLVGMANGEYGEEAHEDLTKVLRYSFDEEASELTYFVEQVIHYYNSKNQDNEVSLLLSSIKDNISPYAYCILGFNMVSQSLEEIVFHLKMNESDREFIVEFSPETYSKEKGEDYNPFKIYGVEDYLSLFEKAKHSFLSELKKLIGEIEFNKQTLNRLEVLS